MKSKQVIPYLVALGIFVITSLIYFHPVLKGEKILQSDITQFRGMVKDIQDYRAETGDEPYWTDSTFSGMPAFQISAHYPNDYVYYVDKIIRFLPRPVDYLFLYFLSFFVLLLALKIDWKLSIVGALTFGFSTYLIIIFGAGHNAKAHAIGYMPLVVAGVLWVFQKRYLLGFIVASISVALEIMANHPQMSYYLFFSLLILGIIELIEALKTKKLKEFTKQITILLVAGCIGIGVNSSRLLSTKEYADASTRGKSELTINPDGSSKESKSGLSKEYITQFSYGIPETFNLIIPRYMGGGTVEELDQDSHAYQFVESLAGKQQASAFTKQVLTYWGDQPIVEAPAYIGAAIFFLFFLGIFIVRGKLKYWLISATIFSILLSWGKNLSFLTNFFIDYVPLYNKFRAVSSIQVIAEMSVPILGILALKQFFEISDKKEQMQKLKKALYIAGGVLVLGLLYAFTSATFEGIRDANYSQYEGFLDAVIADRKSMLYKDTFRSFLLISLVGGALWLYSKEKINRLKTIILVGAVIVFDLVSINLNYVNSDDFQMARKVEKPFTKTNADKEILKDKSHYRVANFTVNPMEDGSTSYFHKSIGGYHAAKMGRYQDLIDFHISKQNQEVFNMLNTKYFILGKEANEVQINQEANGNVWLVKSIRIVDSADEEIKALDSLQTKQEAVVEKSIWKSNYPDMPITYKKDSLSTIELIKYNLAELVYQTDAASQQFAVFSEMYYENGWNAYLDGEKVPHVRVNYVLRGMVIPEGKHTIKFKFEPQTIQKSNKLVLTSYALLLLIPVSWWFFEKRKSS